MGDILHDFDALFAGLDNEAKAVLNIELNELHNFKINEEYEATTSNNIWYEEYYGIGDGTITELEYYSMLNNIVTQTESNNRQHNEGSHKICNPENSKNQSSSDYNQPQVEDNYSIANQTLNNELNNVDDSVINRIISEICADNEQNQNTDDAEPMTCTEELSVLNKEMKRAKNRTAARKYRSKKRKTVEEDDDHIKKLTKENNLLRKDISNKHKYIKEVKKLFHIT